MYGISENNEFSFEVVKLFQNYQTQGIKEGGNFNK